MIQQLYNSITMEDQNITCYTIQRIKKFRARNCGEINYYSSHATYNANSQIKFKTEMLM